jgi:transcriptional regulator with XRE-family HTH domain
MLATDNGQLAGLRRQRREARLSQHALALKAGVGLATVQRAEYGLPTGTVTLRKLADALGVSSGAIMGDAER